MVMNTAEVVCKPFSGLLKFGSVRSRIPVCRIEMQLEVSDDVCIFTFLIAKESPGSDYSSSLVVLQ